ncbi:proteasome accessory factor B [Nocardioides terrae]|uniref:Proteasome accessory factor B n=1 Tax=Nocardioides terrae TaxID=574651 RepID=A0A1I1JH24_9ACTN|nr:WYL domain-containing protein [Nocardioides terrae]SFC47844.1 proteasome accessory factor B [Nocardioides terrae]
MSAQKTERLMNLLIMLLVQKRYVTKERIRDILYADSSDEAFEKMFERDKEELRSLGVPIEVGTTDPLFDDDQGYRISPTEFALPDISLTADEASVVALATKVWEHARLAEATSEAVRKLTAAGAELDVAALDLVQPRLSADEPSFDLFLEAAQERTPVVFDYQRGTNPVETRHLQPWGVVRSSGRWYVVGYDTDRRYDRVFRLSRVRGEVRRDGPPGSFEIPEGTDVRAVARRLTPERTVLRAVLLVRPGTCHPLRRGAISTESGATGPDGESWDRITITRATVDLASEVLSYGPDAYVVEPAELRDAVIERLDGVLA